MAMIHVNRGATSLGVFSEQEVREGLSAGRFAPTDIGWREGTPDEKNDYDEQRHQDDRTEADSHPRHRGKTVILIRK